MSLALVAAVFLGQATLVPDLKYVPQIGDELRIYRRENTILVPVQGAVDQPAFEHLTTFLKAKDPEGLKAMEKEKSIFQLEPGLMVRVIEISNVGISKIPNGSVPYTNQPGSARMQLYLSVQDPQWRSYVVRVLEGENKDRLLLVDKESVRRCAVIEPKGKGKAKKKK